MLSSASSSVDALDQDADHAAARADAERPADRRPAQVGLDQDHPLAGGGERGGEVDRGGRLALRRRGAGDQDRRRRAGCRAALARQGPAQRPVGLGGGGGEAERVERRGSPARRSRAGSGRGSAAGRGGAAAPRGAAAGRGSGARRRRRCPSTRPARSPAAMLSSAAAQTGAVGSAAGSAPGSSGRRTPRSTWSSAIWPCSSGRRRRFSSSWRSRPGRVLVDLARGAGRCAPRPRLGERVGELLRLLGRRGLGGDGDDVALGDRLGGRPSTSSSSGLGGESRSCLTRCGDLDGGDQRRGGLDVAGRVGRARGSAGRLTRFSCAGGAGKMITSASAS